MPMECKYALNVSFKGFIYITSVALVSKSYIKKIKLLARARIDYTEKI